MKERALLFRTTIVLFFYMRYLIIIALLLMAASFLAAGKSAPAYKGPDIMENKPESGFELATLAGGCFWCLEHQYRALDGVLYTEPGYSGGQTENPTYEQVTSGKTGHAEVVQIWYIPDKISYREMVDFFLREAHDPTQLNRQGPDKGTQYRSALFYRNDKEKEIAEEVISDLNQSKYGSEIVTRLETFEKFWPAEEYHRQYYEKYEETTGKPHIRVLLKKKKGEL